MRRPVGVKNSFLSVLTLPERTASAAILPSALFDERCSLDSQEVDAVGFLHRVDRHDVRVVELGEGLRLATKAREPLRIVRHFGGEHLERRGAGGFWGGGAVW